MKIKIKSLVENLKLMNGIVCDFVYIDATNADTALYISTDMQAIKVPLEIMDIKDDEKKVYVINKVEFCHLIPHVTDFITLQKDYVYSSDDNVIKGKFENNESFSEELESRKMLFDKESDYKDFAEITPSVMDRIVSGSIFVSSDSIKASERFLNIKSNKVFSYSKMRIYLNDINIENEGLLSSEVIKSIQSLGVGTIIKSNNDSLLLTNAQRSIFIYQSIPNDVDFLPVLEESFSAKISQAKTFNKITFEINELRDKLDYLSFYAIKNPNSMAFLNIQNEKVLLSTLLSTNESAFVEIENSSLIKSEEFNEMSIPFDCSTLQLICSKIGKECENLTWFVSSSQKNKLMLLCFGDTEEMVVIAKINL